MGIRGHANTNGELVAAVSKQIAGLEAKAGGAAARRPAASRRRRIASAVAIAAVNEGVAPAASDSELRDRVAVSQRTTHYESPVSRS
jgi:hypothetical protein